METTARASASKVRVLLLEDSEADAELVARALRRGGLAVSVERVASATGFETALDDGPWDLVVSDYHVPGYGGPLALEAVRRRAEDLPFIMVSGAVGEEVAAEVMKAGAQDFVLKQNLARLPLAAARELRDARTRRAQRRAQSALRLLEAASATLVGPFDERSSLGRVTALAVADFVAGCAIGLSRGERLELIASSFGDAPRQATVREWFERCFARAAHDDRSPEAQALRRGIPRVEALAGEGALDGGSEEHSLARALQLVSHLVVPIIGERFRVVGVISFVTTGEPVEAAEVDLGRELARRCAHAIENARLLADLERAVQLRDEFLNVASHELKTPVTALQLQTELLQRDRSLTGAGPCRQDRLAAIHAQVRRLARLVDELLDVTRITAGRLPLHLESVDLTELARNAGNNLQSALQAAGCRLSVHSAGPVIGMWDPMRLEQVVTNLLTNAMKYAPGAPIDVSIAADDDTAVLVVRDFGMGIDPADQAKIFGRFERAVRGVRGPTGLGLGLWIVREIVRALGGTVHVESAIGAGTSFVVKLPREPLREHPVDRASVTQWEEHQHAH